MAIELPEHITLFSEGKMHRGYRDKSGRFTMEQCNLSKSNEAGELRVFGERDDLPDDWEEHARCEYCF